MEKRLQLKINKATEESPCDKKHPQIMHTCLVLTQQDTIRTSSEGAALNLTSMVQWQENYTRFVMNPFANRNDSRVTVMYKLSEINGNHTKFSIAVSSFSEPRNVPRLCSLLLAVKAWIVIKAVEPTVVLSLERYGASAWFDISHPEGAGRQQAGMYKTDFVLGILTQTLLRPLQGSSALWTGHQAVDLSMDSHTVESLPDFRCAILVRLING